MTGMRTAGDPNRLFAQAEAAFQEGRLEEAERLLAAVRGLAPSHPSPLHLSALVARRRGLPADAETFFAQARRAAPDDPQIITNHANLLGHLGRLDEALAGYEQALRGAPGFAPALINRAATLQRLERHEAALASLRQLPANHGQSAQVDSMRGASLLALGSLSEAAAAFDRALDAEPNRAKALIGRASVAMQRGEPGAPALLRRAASVQPGDRDVALQLAEAMEAEGDPQAVPILAAAVRTEPDWAKGQSTLARMRWEEGDADHFTGALEQRLNEAPDRPQLWHALVDAFASADLHGQAAEAARRGQQVLGDDTRLIASEAMHSSEAGDLAAADKAYARLGSDLPGIAIAEARHRLRTGEWEQAEQLVARELETDPWSVRGWALQGLLWRLREDARSHWLHEQPGLCAAHQLDLDEGAISAVAERLRGLHRTRAHPLGQSLRGGTQTRGRLFERLEPEVALLRESVRRTLERHWDSLPPPDETHPLLRHRNARPAFAGSWSVRLTDGGFHVAHIHPRGVLSSACYLVVPPISGDEGHLEIGAPPPELGLPLGAIASFAPLPGRMILFPSTLFHGTRPFPTGERLTAAFDVVPR